MQTEVAPAKVRLSDELGQLPEPDMCHEMARDDWREDWSYSADAMRAYAAEQVAAERERCAKVCELRGRALEAARAHADGSLQVADPRYWAPLISLAAEMGKEIRGT